VIPAKVMFQGRERTVREIGEGAFEGRDFTKIVLAPSVRILHGRAFATNKKLVSLELSYESELRVIGREGFRECISLPFVLFPQVLGDRSFMDCISLACVRGLDPSTPGPAPARAGSHGHNIFAA
jgi:hypothetical protein